ncbi:MAG: ABC transporter substrate-binding protein [Gammaproteobacteria bacterium]
MQNIARALILGLALLYAGLSPAAPNPAAVAVVDKLHETLIGVMKRAGTLGYQGRYRTLAPVVNGSFDFPRIAEIVLGRNWKDLNPEQRNAFTDLFIKLSTATYAARFDDFDNEVFRHVSDQTLRGNQVLIKTEIVKADGEAVTLDYILQDKGGKWLIVNVIADGVSDLSLKRADYTAVLKGQGFDALVVKLKQKIAVYEAGEP